MLLKYIAQLSSKMVDILPLVGNKSVCFLRFLLILVNSADSWLWELPWIVTLLLCSFCCHRSGTDINHFFPYPRLFFFLIHVLGLASNSDFAFILDHQSNPDDLIQSLLSQTCTLMWLMRTSRPSRVKTETVGRWSNRMSPEEQSRDPLSSPGLYLGLTSEMNEN